MKFIPLESFGALNSLLQGVEAQGCRITMRLEAYTCRHTKEERVIANNIAVYQNNVSLTPPISPSPGLMAYAAFPAPETLPPLVLGSGAETQAMGSSGGGGGGGGVPYAPVTAEEIDDRLIFFVTALNTVYESDGYDFSVLRESDFVRYTEEDFRTEVVNTLQSLPETCHPAVQRFWPTVEQVVDNAGGGCEYYEFRCPSCDPLADHTVYARHYLLYNRRRKVLVLVVEYGESNLYRGDDGVLRVGGEAATAAAASAWGTDSPTYASTPDHGERAEEVYDGGKNKQFYGYW
ncbi:Maf1 regulator [Novymonas esmeraldas]|uniref:Maf1 regulator n=1 Tax=Novymonas esmeraldas TaxID=1808958 RepID=A0AAW0ETH0_9TRYP